MTTSYQPKLSNALYFIGLASILGAFGITAILYFDEVRFVHNTKTAAENKALAGDLDSQKYMVHCWEQRCGKDRQNPYTSCAWRKIIAARPDAEPSDREALRKACDHFSQLGQKKIDVNRAELEAAMQKHR